MFDIKSPVVVVAGRQVKQIKHEPLFETGGVRAREKEDGRRVLGRALQVFQQVMGANIWYPFLIWSP